MTITRSKVMLPPWVAPADRSALMGSTEATGHRVTAFCCRRKQHHACGGKLAAGRRPRLGLLATDDYPLWRYYPLSARPPEWTGRVIAAFTDAQERLDSRLRLGMDSNKAL